MLRMEKGDFSREAISPRAVIRGVRAASSCVKLPRPSEERVSSGLLGVMFEMPVQRQGDIMVRERWNLAQAVLWC